MPHPKRILNIRQSLLDELRGGPILEGDPILDENGFFTLWDAILSHSFPLDLDYIVAIPTPVAGNGTMPELLVVKVAFGSEDVVVVTRLNRSGDKAPDARDEVVQELVDCIQRYGKTEYPTVYGIASMGLSWTALKVDRSDPDEPKTLVPWLADVASDESFLALKTVADEIRAMANKDISPSTSNTSDSS